LRVTSRVVPTPGTVHHKLVQGLGRSGRRAPEMMARAALLLASEPAAKVNGRVTYSQQILKEFRLDREGRRRGIDTVGSGYSQMLRGARTMTAVSVSRLRRRLRLHRRGRRLRGCVMAIGCRQIPSRTS